MASKFNTEFLRGNKQQEENTTVKNDTLNKFKSTKEIFEKAQAAIETLPIDRLVPFSKHPFKIRENERLEELSNSIKEQGVLVPLIVRVHPEKRGYYEILAGHHRNVGAQRVGLDEIPCIIKNVDDTVAALIVVESNKQRGFSDMLPSEIAFALRLEYDALKSQGKRSDLLTELDEIMCLENVFKYDSGGENGTSGPLDQKLESRDIVAAKNDLSSSSVKRYIRLTYLIEPLLDLVDDGEIAVRAAVDISFLKENEQIYVVDVLDTTSNKIDMKKAEKLKEYSQQNKLTEDTALLIISGAIFEVKGKKVTAVKVPMKKIKSFLPPTLSTTSEYEDYIVKALEYYHENSGE